MNATISIEPPASETADATGWTNAKILSGETTVLMAAGSTGIPSRAT